MTAIDRIIDGRLAAEGGYSNDPSDSGRETNHGITIAVARSYGYRGSMRDLPIDLARNIYYDRYVLAPGFAEVIQVSEAVAEELVDTGVNMGVQVASTFLQRALNAFNNRESLYDDTVVDGDVGPATLKALKAYFAHRGSAAEPAMLKALNCLQGARYIELAERYEKNERFAFGWIANRVSM